MSAITLTQYRNALYTLLTDQKTATPSLIRSVHRWRPGGLGEKPSGWVGDLNDSITYDAGTRFRVVSGEIVVATGYPTDLVTDADPFDQLRDALIERFTSNSAAIASTVLELSSVSEGDLTIQSADGSSVIYRGMTLTTVLRIWEGRD